MTDFWANLTVRERSLLLGAGVLALVVFLYLGLVRPLVAYRAASERSLAAVEEVYDLVAAAADEAARLKVAGTNTAGAASNEPLRIAVAVTARTVGVAISRIQPADDGTLTIWVEDVGAAALYRWLTLLASERNIAPGKVSVQKAGNGRQLRVQLQFEEAA